MDSSRRSLYESVGLFAYGKTLAREAINIIFPRTGKRDYGLNDQERAASLKDLIALVERCNGWTIGQWVNPDNWVLLRDDLAKIIKPNSFSKYHSIQYDHNSSFKFGGKRAGEFGKETVEFVKNVLSGWNFVKKDKKLNEKARCCIDLLETVMRESLVDASLRKEWKNHLVSLCSDYRYIPKSLDIKGLAYPNEERGPIDFGGSADILLAELDGKKVVVKILRADKAIRVSLKKHKWGPLHEEALNWIGLDYPGLNPFFGITMDHPRKDFGIGLVFKYQPLGDSTKYLRDGHNIDRTVFVQSKMFYFVSTLNYLHQMDLVHGDIKGANILVDENGDLLLTDFGLMKRVLLDDDTSTPNSFTASSEASCANSLSGACTLRYASPERLFNYQRSEADDVWATGMTILEFLTGEPPFAKRYCRDLWYLGALGKREIQLLREDLPSSVPDDLFSIIKRCISYDLKDRPSSFELFTVMGQISGRYALRDNMKEGYD